MLSNNNGSALRFVLLAAACWACAAEGLAQHRASSGSLKSDSGAPGGDRAIRGSDTRDTRLSLSPSSPHRSSSPLEENVRLSPSLEEAIYPPPLAKDSSWRFDLKHSVSPSPSRGRGDRPRARSCARCNSVEGMDASTEEGLEKVNLRMDFAHISV
uniref:Uncharacterized protein n=1 Tax=Hemiselmis andersenii TaxID=464988 RepID=A0A6U4IV00_HEMAN|mmetsp:Transcript_4773/g.11040  ORF Transcript_4773/g.11040 Transcript_4773/m.11040 type:complete len:156 (+) Transcript_4773:255-722(+)